MEMLKRPLLFLFILTLGLPVVADAARIRNSSDREGADEEVVRSISTRRGESSATRRKIEKLDEDPVEELPIPVLFGVERRNLYPNFGDARDGGARTHEGFDIMAVEGTPIVSPTKAVVLRTGTGSSAGKYVYTAAPGNETHVYMHLSKIADISNGDELEQGDIIGYVGNTGNASGGAAHLHLEVREGRTAIDPYPRLTAAFPLKDKISFLKDIFKDANNDEELAEFLVAHFRAEFVLAHVAGLELPDDLEDELGTITGLPTAVAESLPVGDLRLGSRSDAVVVLQKTLIVKNIGPAARALAAAGATGYFGAITQNALIEYQVAQNIVPATGYFGPLTRARMASE